jgi:hypothetical protein
MDLLESVGPRPKQARYQAMPISICFKIRELVHLRRGLRRTHSSFFKRGKRIRALQALAFLPCGRVANKGALVKGFPTPQEIEIADKEQLARWYRFLPSGETAADQKVVKRIAERFENSGGMTAELSKKIGM